MSLVWNLKSMLSAQKWLGAQLSAFGVLGKFPKTRQNYRTNFILEGQ
jgi:hypothetical protein